MWDVFLDAALDTAKLAPFLFVLYLLIEIMEHKTEVGKPRPALTGKWAPVLGAGLGIVPMCGFSVMAAKLYEHRHITVGTLAAVFVATSDEGLIVLLLSSAEWPFKLISAAALIGSKLLLGIGLGYLLDALVRGRTLAPLPHHAHGQHEHEHEHGIHVRNEASETHGEADHDDHETGDCACDELTPCEHRHESKLTVYLFSPLWHTFEVALFVFLIDLAFGALFFFVGEEQVVSFMQGGGLWLQPLLCGIVGAIPNCASSVILAEAYSLGAISFGGLLCGLIVNAGLGYLVLLRGRLREGLLLLGGMFLFSVAVGYVACAAGLLF